jgi:trk system potassium uptake protein TrkA
MRLVIVGAGRVGTRTARVLREEGHEVALVDTDSTRVDRLRDEGFEAIRGDGSREDVLEDLDLADADGLAALTADLTVNYMACLVGKARGCRTVLRAITDYQEYVIWRYASDVDEVIYPERLGGVLAKNALLGGSIQAVADVAQNVQVVELAVNDDSPMHGYTLSELELPANARVLAFRKDGGSYSLPSPDQTLETGDRVAVVATFEALDDASWIISGESRTATPAAASGGG